PCGSSLAFPHQGISTPGDAPSWKLEGLPKSRVVGQQPITLMAPNDSAFQESLEKLASPAGSRTTLRLELIGVERTAPAKNAGAGIKVYVNIPAADPTPGSDSLGYVGKVAPFGPKEKDDFAIDLAPALRKLLAKKKWSPDKPLTIRLVAEA